MLEVEVKASLKGVSVLRLRAAVESAWGPCRKALRETDVYFNGGGRDFRKSDEALRLRSCADAVTGQPIETVLTYKGPKQDAVSSTRTEYETSVGSGETAGKLLAALGYREAFTVDKLRREYALDGVTLCLDTVAGLGEFLELELLAPDESRREPAVERLLRLLDQLGVPRENLTRKSYLELLAER